MRQSQQMSGYFLTIQKRGENKELKSAKLRLLMALDFLEGQSTSAQVQKVTGKKLHSVLAHELKDSGFIKIEETSSKHGVSNLYWITDAGRDELYFLYNGKDRA
jgi:chromosome segregation and condensation protein ScpB